MRHKLKILIVEWKVYTPEIAEMVTYPTGGNIALYDIADGVGEYEDVSLLIGQKALKGRKLKHIRLVDTETLYQQIDVPSYVTDANDIHIFKMEQIFEQVLIKGNFDLVNFQGGGRFETDCLEICERHGIKNISTIHLFIGNHRDFGYYGGSIVEENRLFNKPGILVSVVSHGQKRKVLREYPKLQVNRVFVIPNGIRMLPLKVDEEKGTSHILESVRKFAAGRKILLCAGTINARKNQLQLIQAWQNLSIEIKCNVVVIFCGKDSMQKKLQQEIRRRGIEDSLKYIGLLSPEQIAGLYRISDGVISVSRAEGLSLVMLEGISCGKPLIFYRDSECADDIKDDKVVTFIEERSDKAIAEAISRWYAVGWDEDYIRTYAKKNFSRENMILQYIEMFHEIVDMA